MEKIRIDGNNLNLKQFIEVTRGFKKVEIGGQTKKKINKARKLVDKLVEEEKVSYGITTGFGKFSDKVISKKNTKKLQRNLILSHSCGVGQSFEEDIVRGIMLLRINVLSKGHSGIRISTVETLISMLNMGVHPIVPEQGSLGASGDLAPLAHMVLTMIGEGEATYKGERMKSVEAMEKAEIEIIELDTKEGLALINGTQVMTSVGAHTLYDAINLSKAADISASLTNEALNSIVDAYDPRIHEARGQKGQINAAKNLLNILKESNMTTRQGELRVQDAYAIRCAPQVHGASKDCFGFVKEKIEIEMNAATDNPLILVKEKEVRFGGNFHGQPVALPFDFLKLGIAELANISERRLERLVNPSLSQGLPAFLIEEGGVNSGFMIVQYAAAALVSENKTLAHPASVDSIPSSANQEDHVSMGTIASRHARDILNNARKVIAMELLCACQAIDLRGNKGLGKGSTIAYNVVRKDISMVKEDRIMHIDIDRVEEMIKDETIVKEVENVIGQIL